MKINHLSGKSVGYGRGVNESYVKIVWHVRTGDICLHCGDESYFDRVHKMLEESLAGHKYKIFFEAQDQVDFLKVDFPTAQYNIESSLTETICNFITADILITSGSSLAPLVAAIGGMPWKPIIFEEKQKELPPFPPRLKHHYFSNIEAILMDDGVPNIVQSEINFIVKNLIHHHNHLS